MKDLRRVLQLLVAVKSCQAIAAQLPETPFFLTDNGKVASHHYLNQTRHDVRGQYASKTCENFS